MAIEFRCEKCQKKFKVKDELAGKKIKCPGCKEPTTVPAGKQKPVEELNTSDSIITLNLKKFKNKAIDTDDEDFNVEELEGAVALRKKREMQVKSGPPKEPLLPVDWVLCILFGGFCAIYPIVLMVQGKKSRGLKALGLSIGVSVLLVAISVLFYFALNM